MSNEINELKGTLKVVGKTEDKGKYKIQKVCIQKDGGDVWVSVFGGGVNFQEKGNEICFTPGKLPRATITYNDQYKNYTVGEGCSIEVLGKQDSGSLVGTQSAPKSSYTPRKSLEEAAYEADPPKDFKDLVESLLHLHMECDAATRKEYKDSDEETKRSYVSTIFINAMRLGAWKYRPKFN